MELPRSYKVVEYSDKTDFSMWNPATGVREIGKLFYQLPVAQQSMLRSKWAREGRFYEVSPRYGKPESGREPGRNRDRGGYRV